MFNLKEITDKQITIATLCILILFNVFVYPKKKNLETNINFLPFNLLLYHLIYNIFVVIRNTEHID